MALIASLSALLFVALFAAVFTAVGRKILRNARFDLPGGVEGLLCCIAAGVVAYETALALAEFIASPRIGAIALLAVAAAAGASELAPVYRELQGIIGRIAGGSRKEHLLAGVLLATVFFEALASVAPLTGSDALHYHFTVPLLILREGFHPVFSIVNSFFTGQGHLLILTGLAFGSERLSLGFIFLGGLLSTAAGACLARKWVSREWAWLSAITFLVTPVVFWQISAAGAPDVWMSFFATLGVLVVARDPGAATLSTACFGGMLAGALAGAKYTGCLVAFSLALACLCEMRSARKLAIFFGAALATGIWPYARNALWTGDPVFPFLLKWFAPERMNAFTLASVSADTGAAGARSLWHLWQFPLFAAVDTAHLGFWQFFGPLCLVFAPLVIFAARNTPLWRTVVLVWVASGVLIGAATGMTRFLLPLVPMVLAAVYAGVSVIEHSNWRFARALSRVTIGGFLLLGAAALAAYASPAVAASIGLVSRESYLASRAPDYEKVLFVNATVAAQGSAGKTLIFFRHVYPLTVPFVFANPEGSWDVDPAKLPSAEAWQQFVRAKAIRWVVRAPDYPASIAPQLAQLEREGKLVPVARSEVHDFTGLRIFNARASTPIIVFRVQD